MEGDGIRKRDGVRKEIDNGKKGILRREGVKKALGKGRPNLKKGIRCCQEKKKWFVMKVKKEIAGSSGAEGPEGANELGEGEKSNRKRTERTGEGRDALKGEE